MASYRIPAIDQFTFIKPEEWPRWIRRFERFRQASDLTSKSQETQISTLVYSMKKQQAIVRGDSAVDGVKSNRRPRGVPRSKYKPAGTLPKPRMCTRCGKSPPHGKPQCPAREATCHACHKKGHYRHCCKTKESIKQVVVQDDSSDEAFLETIGVNGVATDTPWSVKLLLNKRTQEFKVDTGADVTVIRQAAYKRENNGELVPSNLPSNGPIGEMLCDRARAAFVPLIEPFPWSQVHDVNKSCDTTANHYTS